MVENTWRRARGRAHGRRATAEICLARHGAHGGLGMGSLKSVSGTEGTRPTSPACSSSSAGTAHNSTTRQFRRHDDSPRRLRRPRLPGTRYRLSISKSLPVALQLNEPLDALFRPSGGKFLDCVTHGRITGYDPILKTGKLFCREGLMCSAQRERLRPPRQVVYNWSSVKFWPTRNFNYGCSIRHGDPA